MPLEDFLARLHGVRPSGDGYVARCPAHDDHAVSLSVTCRAGKILVHCFASSRCPAPSIVAALGLTMADLFVNGAAPRKSPVIPAQIVATYDYRDAQGALLFQVVRFDPKTFRQRRPDGAGGWIWGLGTVPRVVYRLPDIAGLSRVFWVEGEKDADRLWAEGLPTVTSLGGSQSFRDEYAAQVKAAGVTEVVLLPDNDDAGHAYVEAVGAGLRAAGIITRVATLPDLPAKSDVSDWLDAGHTAAELLALAEPRLRVLVSAVDFMATPPPEPQWLVNTLLLERANGWLAAGAKIGKSYLALDLLLSAALGEPWLGHFAVPRPLTVVLVEEEDSPWRIFSRLSMLAAGRGLRALPATFYVEVRKGVRLDQAGTLDPLLDDLRMVKPDIVAWDVFNRLHALDERKPDQIMPLLFTLDRLRDELGCSNLVAHHNRKPSVIGSDRGAGGQRLRGPSEFWGWAENSLYLAAIKGKGVLIEPESKDAIVDAFQVHLESNGPARTWIYDGQVAARASTSTENRDAVLAVLSDTGLAIAEIVQASGLSDRRVRGHLASLLADGVVQNIREPGRSGRKLWRRAPEATLADPDSADDRSEVPF